MRKLKFLVYLLLPFLFTGCFRTRADIAKEREEKEVRSSLQQNVLEYNQEMEKMQAEIGRLQGKIEELEHQRKKELSSYSSANETTGKTVQELRGRLEETQKSLTSLFDEIKLLKEENLQLLKAASSGKKKAPEAGYENAMNAYKARDFEAAAAGFRGYLDNNPKSKRNLDARFYLAESLFKKKEYGDAILEFGVIHEKNPASTFGRKSTLRLAESFQALGKDKDAKAFAQILQQTAPKSPEAKQARKFLR